MSEKLDFKTYKTDEAASIPSSPGIYAWYARPLIGKFDWRRDIDGEGKDLGEIRLREVLARHTDRFAPPSLACSSRVAFRDEWSGYLTASTYESSARAILGKEDHSDERFPADAFNKVMSNQASRECIGNLLLESSPVFHSPIYVGKSKDLKTRISTHIAEINKLHKATVDDPELLVKLRKHVSAPADSDSSKKITFAVRAIAAGFLPDHLEVKVLDIGKLGVVDIKTSEYVSEALEWLLNTWQRPLLGRE